MCMLDPKPWHVGGEVELLALTFLVSHLKIERNTVQSPSLHPQHRYKMSHTLVTLVSIYPVDASCCTSCTCVLA